MKYKILVAGKASSIIDDFFMRMSDSFEIMTTSLRHEDILRHVQYFNPHLFAFCMYNENRDDFNKMIALKYQLEQSKVYFALIGSQTDCSDFERAAVNVSDITLVKPLTASDIEARLIEFLASHFNLDIPDLDLEDTSGANTAGDQTASPKSSYQFYTASNAASNDTPEPPRKHILVVDDDYVMLKTVKEMLHRDYNVATAVSGKVAMQFLASKNTDLILLDYDMPTETGPEVLAKIRANERTSKVPVLFLTGATEREKLAKALVHKPQGYLLKPIERETLLEFIKKTLGS